MMTPEGKVKAKVKAILNKLGVYYFMPRGTAFGRAGVPDIICCVNGQFLAIECKANGNKPSMLQEMEIASIKKSGGMAIVVNELDIEQQRVEKTCAILTNTLQSTTAEG